MTSPSAEPGIEHLAEVRPISPDIAMVKVDPINLKTDNVAVRLAIGVLTVGAVIAVAAEHRANPVVASLLSLVVLAYGVLSIIDTAEQRLPNRITVPLACGTAVAVLIGGIARSDVWAALAAMGTGLTLALLLVVLRFGMGDAKLALTVGTIAAWLGRDAIMATAYVGSIAGAVVALILMLMYRRRDVTFSFGPFLALGSVAGMLIPAF